MNKILFIKSSASRKEDLFSHIDKSELEIEFLDKENSYLTKHKDPNLVIVDSPINQNFHLYRKLREEGMQVPIVALSRSDSIETRVKALLQGVDDIIDDEIHPDEFRAKISCLLRRPGTYFMNEINIEDLKINSSKRIVMRSNKLIILRKKEFDLLLFLIKNKGKILTRYEIMENVWPEEDSFVNTVDVHIRYLRKKIDEKFKLKLIHTVYGIGYKLDDQP
jgi:DNA-binding response OmpR family regulator